MTGLNYLLQSNLYLIIFYAFYWILLRKETFNNFNRAYLVLAGLVSFVIPLWNLEIVQAWFITQQTSAVIMQMNMSEYVFIKSNAESVFDITIYLSVIYSIGCIVLALKLALNIFNLYKFVNGNTPISKAFSFFNSIFIADGLDPDDVIYNHEQVHARQFHSFDVMLFEVIGIFCWFNPAIYLYKTAIKNIHEFIADEIASSKMPSKLDYAMLLFSEKFQTHPSVLVNNFFTKTSLKIRIEMLNKKRSNKVAVLKYGLIFPVFLGMLVFASAFIAHGENFSDLMEKGKATILENIITGTILNEENKPVIGAAVVLKGTNRGTTTDLDGNFKINKTESTDVLVISHIGFESKEVRIEDNKTILISLKKHISSLMETVVVAYSPNFFKESIKTENAVIETVNGKIFTIVEQNAEYPGGQQEMNRFLARNLRYPEEAKRNKVEGKVFAKFVVNREGDISDIKILKSLGSGLDEETVRVIGKMPNWIPSKQNGKAVEVEYALPISFVLEKPGNSNTNLNIAVEKTPVYFIDGKEASLEKVKELDVKNIGSVNVLKGEYAIKKYGEKGVDGIIEISLKNDIQTPVEEIFTVVEENAEFPGGQGAMGIFLAKNLRYPDPAQRANVQGKVFLSFIVKKNGDLEDIQVLKGLGYGLDNEAVRVIKAMPKWKPAKQSGREVNSKFNLPISFVLDRRNK